MSNLRDSFSERVVDVSRPSTSQPAPQPFRSKSSLNNKVKESKTASSPKKSPKHSTMPRQKQHEDAKTASKIYTNSSSNDLHSQCQSLSVSESDDVDQGDTPVGAKKKNARKKERLKESKIPPRPVASQPIQHTANTTQQQVSQEHATMIRNQISSVQELFLNQISPLYANTNSRYLENLIHHPQYHLIQQQAHLRQQQQLMAASHASSLLQMMQRPNSANIPSPQSAQSNPSPTGYAQNVMQHPLLSKSFSVENHLIFEQHQRSLNAHQAYLHQTQAYPWTAHQAQAYAQNAQTLFTGAVKSQENSAKKSPAKKKSKKKQESNTNGEDNKFEVYLLPEKVEDGLKNGTLIEGVLRINPKQFQHSYVSSMDRGEQDILIDGIKHRNRAMEGDIVVVQLISDDEEENNAEESTSTPSKQKKGKVVYIKEMVHKRACIGLLKLMPDKNRQKALFIPRDHRVPRLNIPFTCWPDNFYQDAKQYENTLFLAKIIEWFDTRFALGKLQCMIGQSGDMASETQAILAQNDLDITPFGPEYRHLFPRLDYTISPEEITNREDCRKLCIFSIDPSNCRDIDDAVSCRELENGNYEIGVHISDVAHFLAEDTALDDKVMEKATTIYLVEKAYHMLPDELCMLCSLFPGVDKLAFSVFWEITPDAKVLSHRFTKSVIHSCCQLSYDHVQAMLEDRDDAEENCPETYNGYQYEDIYKTVKILGKLSAIFRTRRFEGGALRIDQPKVAFHLNPSNGMPESFWIYESLESHQLIEEFMLLANMTVAARIYEDHPNLAFLRCHPEPSLYMLKELSKALKPMGIELNFSSAEDLHKSLLPYVCSESTDKGRAMVLSMLCAKPMARAKYFCAGCRDDDEFHHYALNVPLYTHFTSPIRRYADIMVHRLLSASLNYREVPNWEVDKVKHVAAQCNKQKFNAKKASEMSTELYTLKYIEMHSPIVTEAVVVDVRERYIDVIIVAMGLNRRIFFNNDFPGEFFCIKNDAGAKLSKMEVKWREVDGLPPVQQVIEVFSILQVEMHKGDDMVKVETKLVRPQN